jgi:hypothetical protein
MIDYSLLDHLRDDVAATAAAAHANDPKAEYDLYAAVAALSTLLLHLTAAVIHMAQTLERRG